MRDRLAKRVDSAAARAGAVSGGGGGQGEDIASLGALCAALRCAVLCCGLPGRAGASPGACLLLAQRQLQLVQAPLRRPARLAGGHARPRRSADSLPRLLTHTHARTFPPSPAQTLQRR